MPRSRSLAVVGLVLVLVLAAALWWRSRSVPQAAHPEGFPVGISFGGTLTAASGSRVDEALDDAVHLGANWIRIDVSWPEIQPGSRTEYHWSGLDRVVDAARARGLHVLGVVTYTAPWARFPGCSDVGCPPADHLAFAHFAGLVAQRYAGRIGAYEIWNEPNLDQFWNGAQAVEYGDLVTRTVQAVRRVDRRVRLLLGGLAADVAQGATPTTDFLTAACAHDHCLGVDGVGVHPYTSPLTAREKSAEGTPWQRLTGAFGGKPSLVDAMSQVGLAHVPLWVTEYGAPTGGASSTDHVSERRQAEIVASGISAATSQPKIFGAVFIYSWRDLGNGTTTEDHYGLRRSDGSPKPAYRAMLQSTRG